MKIQIKEKKEILVLKRQTQWGELELRTNSESCKALEREDRYD